MCKLDCCENGSMLDCIFAKEEEDTDIVIVGNESVFCVPFGTIQA